MHQQLIMNIIYLFTPQSKVDFYSKIFDSLDLSDFPDEVNSNNSGPDGFSRHALFRAFIVMKCEKFSEITQLHEYLFNNQIIAHACGFDITKKLPSYWTYRRFIKNTAHEWFTTVMQSQVKTLVSLGIIDGSFVSLDSTSIEANTSKNNSKFFDKSRFDKSLQPKSDKDCKLGVRTASNAYNEKNYEFYWGYKNHILVDAITGLPIAEVTTTANITDSEIAIPLLKSTHSWLPLDETYFIADKGYDVRDIYNFVHNELHGHCFIPLNQRRTKKNLNSLTCGNPICDAGFAMQKDGRQYLKGSIKQKFRCPFHSSKDDSACICNHPKFFNGAKKRGCIKYVSTGTDYRASINRDSKYFKSIYSLRSESERYNSRWKNLNTDKASVRNMAAIENLNTIGHICLLALAIAAVKSGKTNCLKSLKNFKKSA
ncbi:MAG: transposase [Caulobacteraceae bacterium]